MRLLRNYETSALICCDSTYLFFYLSVSKSEISTIYFALTLLIRSLISDEFCEEYPHNLIPTPGYWVECSRQKINMGNMAGWPPSNESDSEQDEPESKGARGGNSDSHLERGCSDLYEDDEDSEAAPSTRKRSAIEEQWEVMAGFELTSVEQETYERYFYGTEHWNYFTNDEDLGPVILSIKQENLNGRDQFRILVRAISYTVHGLIPASCVFADR